MNSRFSVDFRHCNEARISLFGALCITPQSLGVKTAIFAPLFSLSIMLRLKGATHTMRGGAVVARRAHNPKVIGSSPVPATAADN